MAPAAGPRIICFMSSVCLVYGALAAAVVGVVSVLARAWSIIFGQFAFVFFSIISNPQIVMFEISTLKKAIEFWCLLVLFSCLGAFLVLFYFNSGHENASYFSTCNKKAT